MPEWIPYETSDEPSLEVSIDVDLDGDATFQAAHPYLVTIAASGFPTDADGQPTDAAAENLFALEQSAEAACEANDATPAFTVSGGGKYQLFAYAKSGIEGALREAFASASVSVSVTSQRDESWATYGEYALRGDDLEDARDCDLIAQMEEAGEDLSVDYVVTFAWSVDDTKVKAALEALRSAGYDVPVEIEDDIIQVEVEMQISPENLVQQRTAMSKALAPFAPQFEGWEADGLDDEEPI
jgi:hypothetical protein